MSNVAELRSEIISTAYDLFSAGENGGENGDCIARESLIEHIGDVLDDLIKAAASERE